MYFTLNQDVHIFKSDAVLAVFDDNTTIPHGTNVQYWKIFNNMPSVKIKLINTSHAKRAELTFHKA